MKRHFSMNLLRILTFSSGPAIIILFYSALFFLKGSIPNDISEEIFIILFQLIWISIPFFALGLYGQTRYLPWLIAVILNVAFLIYILVDAKRAAQEGTGVNIGAGLFFFALPVIITFVCLSFKKVELTSNNENSELR